MTLGCGPQMVQTAQYQHVTVPIYVAFDRFDSPALVDDAKGR
jgi:hypothetical protein